MYLNSYFSDSVNFWIFFSTISSGYNAVAAILLEDFVKPCFPNMKSSTMTIFSKIVSK